VRKGRFWTFYPKPRKKEKKTKGDRTMNEHTQKASRPTGEGQAADDGRGDCTPTDSHSTTKDTRGQPERFSFRWGIPLLDASHTAIPNFILDHYIEAGVARHEFLVIVHLARYQFEQAGSECRPALATVADQMGYTVRGLRKILAGLEKRGLLERHYRPGMTTVYDFSGFSKAVLAMAQGGEPQFPPEPRFRGGEEPQFQSTPEPEFRTPRNSSSAKNKREQEKPKEAGTKQAGGVVSLEEHIIALLIDFGVSESMAKKLSKECDPDLVDAWLNYACEAKNLRDPAAFLVAKLQAGETPPKKQRRDHQRRYIEGKYAEYIEH
jgi:hypothetical protein